MLGGFIETDSEGRTVVTDGMVAGDICHKKVRQIVNSAVEGAVAAVTAEEYLDNMKQALQVAA